MEADGETPWEACRREVREECGIEVRRGRLACMDFRHPKPGRAGGIRFLFDCGQVDDEALAGIVVQPEEVSEYRRSRTAPRPDPAAGPRGHQPQEAGLPGERPAGPGGGLAGPLAGRFVGQVHHAGAERLRAG